MPYNNFENDHTLLMSTFIKATRTRPLCLSDCSSFNSQKKFATVAANLYIEN